VVAAANGSFESGTKDDPAKDYTKLTYEATGITVSSHTVTLGAVHGTDDDCLILL